MRRESCEMPRWKALMKSIYVMPTSSIKIMAPNSIMHIYAITLLPPYTAAVSVKVMCDPP